MNADLDDSFRDLLAQDISREGVAGRKNYLSLLCEYWHLSLSQRLSKEQADRLQALLDLAESDTLLATIFSEANYFVVREHGLLKNTRHYRKAQENIATKLKTSQELTNWDKKLKEDKLSDNCLPNDFGNHKRLESLLQERLKYKGYYGGPIDGYFGPISKLALEYFQRKENLVQEAISLEPAGESLLIGASTLIALLT